MAAPEQIPPVTMEDLQAFQARHFPGTSTNNWYDENITDGDGDGLGYYADGVKRTLTDQEIEIFRHSEIQSLLRERRLKEQARLEEMGDDIPNDAKGPDHGAQKANSFFTREKLEADKAEKQPGPSKSRKGEGEYIEVEEVTACEKRKEMGPEPETASSSTLDYGGDSSVRVNSDTSPSQTQASFMGRKMVSYAD